MSDAAFLELGASGSKNGFIHVDELIHDKGRNARIENILRPGDEILVQIHKEAIKDKGPNMSMYLSLPGRYLVLMHSDEARGVSKRIEDPLVRKRLKRLLDSFEAPPGFGFIVRTAAAERDESEIRLDYEFLKRMWAEIEALAKRTKGGACVYQEADMVVRTLRDVAGPDAEAIIVDEEKLYDEARAFAQVFMPEICDKIQFHREELPLFTYYGIEERLAQIYDRKVDLPSGGAIVIEQTEALVSIDVNSAKNRDAGDVETTALMTNLEAANSIAEQLVLRDLGGLIIIDFIDMESREHQRMVQLALRRALSGDKSKIQVGPLSRFGLVEMTRQRQRPSHKLVSSAECPLCRGTGSVKTSETLEIDCMREIRQLLHSRSLARLEVVMPQDVALAVLNARHRELAELEAKTECRIVFTGDVLMKAREFRLVPTFRKGERSGRERVKPVRPSLLAPLLLEQAKAIKLAKELAAMKPAELERELNDDPVPAADQPPKPAAEAVPVQIVAAVRVPTVQDEAIELRRLLFSSNTPVRVGAPSPSAGHAGPSQQALASVGATATKSPPRGGRHRRHRR
jgi:ribonuclease E